ncbi:hypothetical protein MASR1M45_02850 [Candidatus Kapaibacterium sp.]
MKTYNILEKYLPKTVYKPVYEKVELIPADLNYSINQIRKFSSEDFDSFCETLRIHLLELYTSGHGVFYSNNSAAEIIDNFRELINIDVVKYISYQNGKKIIKRDSFNQANQWFPEMADVKVINKSMVDQLRDSKIFRQNIYDILIKDRHKRGEESNGMARISEFIIDSLRIVNKFQPVFNFPSTIAKFIYTTVISRDMDKNEWYILDNSLGWAGRLVGLLSTASNPICNDKIIHYYGTDVNQATKGRFEDIINFWNENIDTGINDKFDFYRSFEPAETLLNDLIFQGMEGCFDFSFTSPAYFDREKYSDDENQSYKKFPTYDEWRDGFLRGLIENTYKLLKPNSEFWLNISDIATNRSRDEFYPLQDDAIRIAESVGFKHVDTLYLATHTFPGYRPKVNIINDGGKIKKYEPVFCFRKGE